MHLLEKFKWVIFAVIVTGILATLIVFSDSSKIDTNKINVNAIQVASEDNGNIADHVFGKVGSKVTLIEYGDYQCPGCGSINPSIESVIHQYKDQIQFVFRNFPLPTSHANAKAAAAAVEAAGLQGKYWEMHTKVYASQSEWESLSGTNRTNFFANSATDMGLDANKFKTDMASSAIDAKINLDREIGMKAGVDSTPSFYLNGTRLDSKVWGEMSKLKDVIGAELTKAGIALPAANE